MDERIKESISALMDDESNELEVRRVLAHSDDQELKDVWQRYHVVRNVMQNPSFDLNDIDVSAAVSASISESEVKSVVQESAELQSAAPSTRRFGRYVSVASAACMLFVLALFLEPGKGLDGSTAVDGVQTFAANNAGVNEPLQKVASQSSPKIVVEMTEEQAQKFNQYLLRHAEHASLGGGTGTMPLARVASFNAIGI